MAQEGYDELLALTDSRYRLSMVVARRAAQLKNGIPTILDSDKYPRTRNTVTVAMKELTDADGIVWGKDMPSIQELKQIVDRERRDSPDGYSISRDTQAENA